MGLDHLTTPDGEKNMKNFFDYDGTLNRILTKVMYVVALNLLFLLCSVPLFTIGAASTAMYTVLMRYLREDEPDIIRAMLKYGKKENVTKGIRDALNGGILTVTQRTASKSG